MARSYVIFGESHRSLFAVSRRFGIGDPAAVRIGFGDRPGGYATANSGRTGAFLRGNPSI